MPKWVDFEIRIHFSIQVFLVSSPFFSLIPWFNLCVRVFFFFCCYFWCFTLAQIVVVFTATACFDVKSFCMVQETEIKSDNDKHSKGSVNPKMGQFNTWIVKCVVSRWFVEQFQKYNKMMALSLAHPFIQMLPLLPSSSSSKSRCVCNIHQTHKHTFAFAPIHSDTNLYLDRCTLLKLKWLWPFHQNRIYTL